MIRRAAIFAAIALCILGSAAVSAGKEAAKPKKLSEQDAASLVIKDFLTAMDKKDYNKAFTLIDFDALIKDQLKMDPAKMKPKEKERQVKAYQNIIKNMFESEKKQVKFKNFSIGGFKKNDKDGTASLELVNTPPKGSADKPIVKTFKMALVKKEWKIFGIVQQAAAK